MERMKTPDVRWRETEGRRWRYGHLVKRNDDGTVELVDHWTGAVRTMDPRRVQHAVVGPRGGHGWGVDISDGL